MEKCTRVMSECFTLFLFSSSKTLFLPTVPTFAVRDDSALRALSSLSDSKCWNGGEKLVDYLLRCHKNCSIFFNLDFSLPLSCHLGAVSS